jgi:hypothetical protein
MKLVHENGEVTGAFINLGTLAIARQKLAKMLPDIERFERCLPTALYISEHDGAWPPGWHPTGAECTDMVDTLRELATIELDVADELETERAGRFP